MRLRLSWGPAVPAAGSEALLACERVFCRCGFGWTPYVGCLALGPGLCPAARSGMNEPGRADDVLRAAVVEGLPRTPCGDCGATGAITVRFGRPSLEDRAELEAGEETLRIGCESCSGRVWTLDLEWPRA